MRSDLVGTYSDLVGWTERGAKGGVDKGESDKACDKELGGEEQEQREGVYVPSAIR